MQHDVVLGLKQYFPVAVPYMLVAPVMIFIGNIYFEEFGSGYAKWSKPGKAGFALIWLQFFLERNGNKKKNLTFKINANQLENHLVPINEHSILSQAI